MDEETTDWVRGLRPIASDELNIDTSRDIENPYLRNLHRLKNKMITQIDARLDKSRGPTTQTCRLSMIPIHLVEYDMKKDTKTDMTRHNSTQKVACLGKVLVGGCPPHVRFILRKTSLKSIEEFAKRTKKIENANSKINSFINRVSNTY